MPLKDDTDSKEKVSSGPATSRSKLVARYGRRPETGTRRGRKPHRVPQCGKCSQGLQIGKICRKPDINGRERIKTARMRERNAASLPQRSAAQARREETSQRHKRARQPEGTTPRTAGRTVTAVAAQPAARVRTARRGGGEPRTKRRPTREQRQDEKPTMETRTTTRGGTEDDERKEDGVSD